jgi:hypothetical protein
MRRSRPGEPVDTMVCRRFAGERSRHLFGGGPWREALWSTTGTFGCSVTWTRQMVSRHAPLPRGRRVASSRRYPPRAVETFSDDPGPCAAPSRWCRVDRRLGASKGAASPSGDIAPAESLGNQGCDASFGRRRTAGRSMPSGRARLSRTRPPSGGRTSLAMAPASVGAWRRMSRKTEVASPSGA